jgi:protein TonB
MLIHLIETGRHRLWHSSSAFWSTGTHAALAASIIVGAMPSKEPEQPRAQREVVYLLPTLPAGPTRAVDARVTFHGEGQGVGPAKGAGLLPAGHDDAQSGAVQPVRADVMPVVEDSVQRAGMPVFIAADLDRIVERDPTSAAPAYPPDLERQQIEGGVLAEWVVDTTGYADTTSFRVVTATHPGFVSAVRAALPLMHFRPAELLGRPVAQMVRQEFTFRIHLPTPDTTRVPPR